MVSVVLSLTGEMSVSDGGNDMLIGQMAIGARTSWDRLDSELGKVFNVRKLNYISQWRSQGGGGGR